MKERTKNTEVFRVAEGMFETFIQRKDLYARQLDNGQYICIHKPLTIDHIVGHLRGQITLGTYILDENNNARFTVLDADDDWNFERLISVDKSVSFPSYLETSRRGGHMWMFFENIIPGEYAKLFGMRLVDKYKLEGVEVYPKQGKSDGPGSLIRVPFGIHRKSGERYGFINPDGSRLGTWIEQMRDLSSPSKIPTNALNIHGHEDLVRIEKKSENKLWDRIKTELPIIDFVGQYVELKETSSGAVGLCPFHYDIHHSLGLSETGNYWHCFAGCGGGSVIDFWMKWRDCDFKDAVEELSQLLPYD